MIDGPALDGVVEGRPPNARYDARLEESATNGVTGNSPKPTREVSLYQFLDPQDLFPVYSDQLPAGVRRHR